MPAKFRLLIGGIGDDAHSVGIRLLHLGFVESDFHVTNIGIRNDLPDFFNEARSHDIIMISNKNGHAELYLQDFPRLLSEFRLTDSSRKLWYLGGSLSVSESDFATKKKFINMGFTEVYPKPVSFQQLLTDITADLHRYDIKKKEFSASKRYVYRTQFDYSLIRDRKWTNEELEQERKIVLREWHTGSDILNGINRYSSKKDVTLDSLLWSAQMASNGPLLQPRTGVATIEDQLSLLQFLEEKGSDVSSVQLDAASRSKKFDKAQLGAEMSRSQRRSVLNGFPLPIYTIEQIEKLVCGVKAPFQLRGGGPDHRFTYEMALQSNISGVEGGFICYLMPYDKDTDPIQSMNYWQYIDRLCSKHHDDYGVAINREYFGVLTATLIEPSLAIVVNVIQALMSAQQGVTSISAGYAEQGNRTQDIAAISVLYEMVRFYLAKFKFTECRVTTVFHQFMAAFPQDYPKAKELIKNSTITGHLAGATKIMVKTAAEAFNIPTRYDNAEALMICREAIAVSKHTELNVELIKTEKAILRQQVHQIMDVILELGNGSVAIGSVKAIEDGILDIPWSPNVYNKNRVVSLRDATGAIRYDDFANLPFSQSIKEFHLEKIHIRKTLERDSSIFSLLEKDLSRIWKNDYLSWPLDECYVN